MIGFDDDRPVKKPPAHQIGEELAALSLGELAARVDLLRAEIARLELAMADRRRTREVAGGFFKSPGSGGS